MSTLNGASSVVKDGLVFYVDPASPSSFVGTGSVFYDRTTNNLRGSLIGTPSVAYFRPENGGIFRLHTTAPSGFASGRTASNYIKFGTGVPVTGLTNSSMSIFVRILQNTGHENAAILFSRYGTTTNNGGFQLTYGTNNQKFYLEHRTGGITSDYYGGASSTTTAVLNTWYQVCATIEGNQRKLYINGQLEMATQSGYGNTASYISLNTYIGNQSDVDTSFSYYACIDFSCAMIYNRALSASEVSQNFNVLRYRFGI